MICNYQNINDYCCNRYTYFYNDVVSSNGIVTVDDSELASVLRVDNVTGETKVLSPNSTDQIPTCEANDDNEGTNDWECYIISRYVCQNSVGDPPFGIFQEKQKEIIKETYNAALQDGIVVAINNKNVLLPGSIQDQILYKSILSYAQALYDDDTDSTMPSFTDVNGTIYNLSYTDLVAVFKIYFTKAIYYKNLQDTLLTQAEQASTMSDLEQCTWCGTKPLVGTLQPTKYSSQPLPAQVSVVDCSDPEYSNCVPYSAGPEFGLTPIGLVPASVQTIRVPDHLTLPVTATFSAGCDDGLAINGERISGFAEIPPAFTVATRTFEAGVWNDLGPWACNGEFCFEEVNPLP